MATRQGGSVTGITTVKAVTITLPISVNTILGAVAVTKSESTNKGTNSGMTDNYTSTSLVAVFGSPAGVWVAFCI